MIVLFLYLALALGISFLCSILEAALLSMTPSFVSQVEQSGATYGKRLGLLKANVDQALSGILTLNTVAHTVGAAGVGSQAVAIFGESYFGVISAILTLLILFFSEIIPKTLGAQHWRSLARFTTYACHGIVIATYPLVMITKRLTALLESEDADKASVSRDEIVALAHLGRNEGILAESESRMIRSLIRFRDLRVNDIMTPRTVLSSLPESTTCEEAFELEMCVRFTRIPLFQEKRDEITGYVIKSDLLQKIAKGAPKTSLGELKRPIRVVSNFDTLPKVFDDLHFHHEHIAIVVDEYGGISGIVTLEDIIETLLGLEIVDEMDSEVDMRELARKRWKKRAKEMGIEVSE